MKSASLCYGGSGQGLEEGVLRAISKITVEGGAGLTSQPLRIGRVKGTDPSDGQ